MSPGRSDPLPVLWGSDLSLGKSAKEEEGIGREAGFLSRFFPFFFLADFPGGEGSSALPDAETKDPEWAESAGEPALLRDL